LFAQCSAAYTTKISYEILTQAWSTHCIFTNLFKCEKSPDFPTSLQFSAKYHVKRCMQYSTKSQQIGPSPV